MMVKKEIVASITPEDIRVVIMENKEVVEYILERADCHSITGNIYKGKVKNILPGMQAAFVDIGEGKNAFLYGGIGLAKKTEVNVLKDKNASKEIHNENKKKLTTIRNHSLWTVGQDLLLQIVKDPAGTKGARATTHISIPGRYVVLMPTINYIGVSRNVENRSEKYRLRKLAESLRNPGTGLIMRTVAQDKSDEEISNDVEYLYNLWHSITTRARRQSAPALLYRDVDLPIRIVRDYLTNDVEAFYLDDKETFQRVRDLTDYLSPELIEKVHFFDSKEEIFKNKNVEEEIINLTERQVNLKCGGYIVIDHTEALTAIDVNTGRFIGRNNLEETVFRTNMEAAYEIARQIRLRDLSGIIIVDFIDMENEEHQKAVLEKLAEQSKRDRTKVHVVGLTALGLVEITRKKTRLNLLSSSYETCPVCKKKGIIKTAAVILEEIKRALYYLNMKQTERVPVIIEVQERVMKALSVKELDFWQEELKRKIRMQVNNNLSVEMFSIILDKK